MEDQMIRKLNTNVASDAGLDTPKSSELTEVIMRNIDLNDNLYDVINRLEIALNKVLRHDQSASESKKENVYESKYTTELTRNIDCINYNTENHYYRINHIITRLECY